jgi:hypothetical protein
MRDAHRHLRQSARKKSFAKPAPLFVCVILTEASNVSGWKDLGQRRGSAAGSGFALLHPPGIPALCDNISQGSAIVEPVGLAPPTIS